MAGELLQSCRMRTMKRPALLLTGILAAVILASAGSTARNFEGRWVLDKKSPGAAAAPQDLTQQIKMDGSQMIIRSKFAQPKNGIYPMLWVGIMTEELALTTDGSEAQKSIGPFQ